MLDRMGNDDGEQVVRGIAQEVVHKLEEMGAPLGQLRRGTSLQGVGAEL
jgi:hypothetical protein